jgi:hypothetical protein
MRVIPPLTLTEAMVISSTAAEPGVNETDWDSGATYAEGDRVIVGAPSTTVSITVGSPGIVNWVTHGLAEGTLVVLSTTGALPTGLDAAAPYYVRNPLVNTFQLSALPGGAPIVTSGMQSGVHTATAAVHRIFESLQDANANHAPAIADSVTWWQDAGPTNKWAMFDLLRNTGTTVATPLVVQIKPGNRVDSIALVGLAASQVQITMTDTSGTIYTATDVLNLRTVATWSDYFFDALSFRESVVHFDLPISPGATITVTISNPVGNVTCGGLILGMNVYVGRTLHQAENDALNFSTIDRDFYGNSVLVQRRTVPKVNAQVRTTKANVPALVLLRKLLNAAPALWAGLDTEDDGYFGSLLVLGIYKQFLITADMPEEALVSLSLEEV